MIATVNDLPLYYEIHGDGAPLVLLHGGGSTIESTYGRILPVLAKTHRVIAVELQAHGHTPDRDRPLGFEQDADDVAALLGRLDIDRADVMGFSNGATTTLQIGIRHPGLVNKLVTVAATHRRDGLIPGFFDGFPGATLDQMPKPLADAYLAANPDPRGLQRMFDRDVERMMAFKDIPDTAIQGIQAPTLVINADRDVILPEHALRLSRTLAQGRLLIVPGVHGECIGEICTWDKSSTLPYLVTEMIEVFLKSNT
jgi:pimeloyl-ACP methyl ester carboxylesterase